jgi:hypothetical protein
MVTRWSACQADSVAACRYVELLDELATDENFLKIQKREQPDSEKETDR